MKYIKEYSIREEFTPEDVQDIRDIYLDMIDDLNLYDNIFFIFNVNDSSFQEPRKYEGKMCKIFIRTISNEIPDNEDISHHNNILSGIRLHLRRLKNMGYFIDLKELKSGISPTPRVIEIVIKK